MLKVIAIDPGPHIGLAVRNEVGKPVVLMVQNNAEDVVHLILENKPDVLVVERFATGGRLSKYGHETIEIVGIMRGLCYATGIKFVRQVPQYRYAFLSEAKSELKGLYKNLTQHEIDAYAHLLAWEHYHAND